MSYSKGKTKTDAGQEAIERFTEMMIRRMEAMRDSQWQQGWVGASSGLMRPQNISGRTYSGLNTLMLQLYMAEKGYELPVFMTYLQAQEAGANVTKGEKSFPVTYWNFFIKDKDGKKVPYEDYKNMSRDEQHKCTVIPNLKVYRVFNIQQTNYAEVKPEKYEKIKAKFKVPEARTEEGLYVNQAIDNLIGHQSWVCPIHPQPQDGAFYSLTKDAIFVPEKKQFFTGEQFYGTLLHEMTHSTGVESRLNRTMGTTFGDKDYAREELVAELSAAMMAASMGFDKLIKDESAKYLNAWLDSLEENPQFLKSIMSDVNHATDLVLNHIDRERLRIGERPYLSKNDPFIPSAVDEVCPFQDVSMVKMKNGEYAMRGSYKGTSLGMMKATQEDVDFYNASNDFEKKVFVATKLRTAFQDKIQAIDAEMKASNKQGPKL